MILTNKQAIILYQILKDSLKVLDKEEDGFIFSHSQTCRFDLYQEIYLQQSNKLIDLEENKNDV